MNRHAVAGTSVLALVLIASGCGLGGASAPQAAEQTAAAKRGDLVVSVGGLGKIVPARGGGQTTAPAAPTTTGAAGGPGSTSQPVSADAVLPLAAGRVATLLVQPGERVRAGQLLAKLDDGGTAVAAVGKAENDLAAATLELRQRRLTDPLKGIPATPTELAAGRFAVTSARAKLRLVKSPPRPAEVSAARLELQKAEADLEMLRGGSRAARAAAVELARQGVTLAQQRLDQLLAPPNAADVAAAEADVKRAEADLADLQRADPPASAEALAAARKAVDAARLKLAQVLAPPSAADVTAARLELAKAQAELRTLAAGPTQTALAAARQAVTAARVKLRQLLGPPLRSDLVGAKLEVRKALADLAVLRARGGPSSAIDLQLGELRVDAARAALRVAQHGTDVLSVRAPWSGTVTSVMSFPGAAVDPTTPLAEVTDLDHLAVSVDLSEFDAAQVKRGQPATVSVDALGGKKVSGRVGLEALTGIDNAGVVTFPVRIALTHVAGVKPGMNASVRIVVARRRDVVHVPLEAVTREGGEATVTVAAPGGKTTDRRVKLGLSNNKDVEVVRGLRPGERVVIASQGE